MHTNRRVLILVRTYPTPAKQGVEVSCTAGITDEGDWIRLFPVPYRLLDSDKRFHKYQWIEVEAGKSTSDPRPESHKIRPQTIKIVSDVLSVDNSWRARKSVLESVKGHCLCCLKERRDEYGFPTLGFIKPKRIVRLTIKKQEQPEWSQAQRDALSQKSLFDELPARELEKIPFYFQYEFYCDHDECNGHKLSCTDWEMGESWRKWQREYGDDWQAAFRKKYEAEMLESKDLHFFVGTINAHPKEWIIVGLFYPPRLAALPLFD